MRAMPALTKQNDFIAVVPPAMSFIIDQVFKMSSHFKIPSAMMRSGYSCERRKSIFLEIA